MASFKSPTNSFISKPRSEPALPNLSERYLEMEKGHFTKDQSVFGEFKEDDAIHLKQMQDFDLKNWRVAKFV